MVRTAALIGVLIISFSAIWVRLAALPPITAALFRALYALPALYLIWRWERSKDRRTPAQRRLGLLAGVLLGLDFVFWHQAIDWIGAGLATVLGNTQVVFVALAAWAIHGERPGRRALAILPAILLGVVLISGLGGADAYGARPVWGVAAGIFTGLTYAAFLLLLRASNRSLSPPAGPMLDASLGAMVVCLVIGLAEGGLELVPTWPAHGWLLALALGSQVLGWQLIGHALPRLRALETSVILLLQPVATVLWGFLLFAEHLSTLQWAGVGMVLLGILALSVKKGSEQQSTDRPASEVSAEAS